MHEAPQKSDWMTSRPAATRPVPDAPRPTQLRRKDRRPRDVEKRLKKSFAISPRTFSLLEDEVRRRGFPSTSALVEHAINNELHNQSERDQQDDVVPAMTHAMREMSDRLRQLEQDTAERDLLATEMMAGFVRAFFAMTPTPQSDRRDEQFAAAEAQFDRFIGAVSRRIERGETTLRKAPDERVSDDEAGSEWAESRAA